MTHGTNGRHQRSGGGEWTLQLAVGDGGCGQRSRRLSVSAFVIACLVLPSVTFGQGITGALIGTVSDHDGGVLRGAVAHLASPALIGSPSSVETNDRGQLRFQGLPPGLYTLDISLAGFAAYHEENIRIGAAATIERTVRLSIAGRAESIVVEGTGSRIETRDAGFGVRFGVDDLRSIPTRRSSMFDFIRTAPGISPTSPSGSTVNTVSAFGSGTNENTFLIDGTNFTCPCNGIARSEPGVDFIEEIHVQSVGASAEFGNVQGAVINVVTTQGSDRFLYSGSYYGQTSGLTSQPVRLPVSGAITLESGYERARYRDFASSLGGPAIRRRLWFFAGYHHLRDYDSQPGTDPAFPRRNQQDKSIGKLTWKLASRWQLVSSFYNEDWVIPEQPTATKRFDATFRRSASVPAWTLGHLTHVWSANTVWDVRLGRFAYTQNDEPSTGDATIVGRMDAATGISSGAPQLIGGPTIVRTTAKGTVSHYRPAVMGVDHQWKVGAQIEKGEHHSTSLIPTGRRFVDVRDQPSEVVSSPPTHIGASFTTAAAFASDAVTVGNRLTLNAGIRFDHHRAGSQDLAAIDSNGRETGDIIPGLGPLYRWNVWSPRLGLVFKLSRDARTILRASYGRFSQGILTGEIQPFHPGATSVTTTAFSAETGDFTGASRVVDPRVNLVLDSNTRAPYTNELSVGVDREIGRRISVAVAYVRKDGRDFIGWTDIGGHYDEASRLLPDGTSLPVQVLTNDSSDRRFLLTNPDGYSMRYNGLVAVLEKRRSDRFQAFASYTWSRASGLQPSSGTSAAGAQVSTVAPPPAPAGLTFGRDPNDLTNARGRLPNDRPHIFRVMGNAEVPRTGIVIAGNFQYFSGKPWAASALVDLPQARQLRVLLESRGSRRLASQSLLDLRLSRRIRFNRVGRVELLADVLNVLNDTAEEALATDVLFNSNFARPIVFMDPRRAMLGVRVNLGR